MELHSSNKRKKMDELLLKELEEFPSNLDC